MRGLWLVMLAASAAPTAHAASLPPSLVGAAAAPGDDPPVRLELNRETYSAGDEARVEVRTREDGYLLVLAAFPDGRVRVLFPLDPGDDAFVRGGRSYRVVGRGGRGAFMVDGRGGQGTILAGVAPGRFRTDGYAVNGHWDFGALSPAPGLADSDPEAALLEIADKMVGGRFQYDVRRFRVDGPEPTASGALEPVGASVVGGYAPSYPPYVGPVYAPVYGGITPVVGGWCDPIWGYSYGCGYGFGIGLGFRLGSFGYASIGVPFARAAYFAPVYRPWWPAYRSWGSIYRPWWPAYGGWGRRLAVPVYRPYVVPRSYVPRFVAPAYRAAPRPVYVPRTWGGTAPAAGAGRSWGGVPRGGYGGGGFRGGGGHGRH